MTLRRARLCGNDARGFTFAREISSSFNGRRRLTGHPRGLWRLVAVGETEKPKIDFQFFAKGTSFQNSSRAPFGFRFRVSELSFRDLSNVTRLASSASLFTGSRHNELQKAPRASDFEWRTRLRVFPGAIDTLRRVRDGASHFSDARSGPSSRTVTCAP